MKLITAALIKAKANFKPIHKSKINPHFKSKYAGLDAILDAITTALTDVGVLLIQPTSIIEDKVILNTILIHAESGEQIESNLLIPTQSDPQKLGSALTYYRRFSLCALLAIAPDEDDDGNTAHHSSKPLPFSREAELRSLSTKLHLCDTAISDLVHQHFDTRVSLMSAAQFDRLKSLLHQSASSSVGLRPAEGNRST